MTQEGTAPALGANSPVLEVTASGNEYERRQRRILQLRETIETGEYHVPSPDLADALLRSAHRSN